VIAIGDLELHIGAALSAKPLLRLSPNLNAVHLASKLSENIRDGVGAVPAAASSVPKDAPSGSSAGTLSPVLPRSDFGGFDGVSRLWLKLGRGLVAPKARDDKTRGMTTPDEIASENKKA
jgi:hypothetical protein